MKAKLEVHKSHAPLWKRNDWRYALIMGGRGNGRSGTASRYGLSQLLSKNYVRGAIMRAISSDIDTSCWTELNDRIIEQNLENKVEVTDKEMIFGANSLRKFGFKASSGSLTARLKSIAGYNLIWIEEAEEIGEDEFRTLDDSLRTIKGNIRIIFTLNTPPKSHWIMKKWFDTTEEHPEAKGFFIPKLKPEAKDAIYISGTWRENEPNLDKHTIQRYQEYKRTNPSYYWQVIEGLSPEEVRGKIFTGWQLTDVIPEKATLKRFGIDWGWFPDPAVVTAIYEYAGSYYVKQLAYDNYLSNESIADAIKSVPHWRGIRTVCGVDDQKSMKELQKYGITAVKAVTGQGSVDFRIKVTSQRKVFVERGSDKVWESYENYRWAEDKDGNPKGEPDHFMSDGMDSVSYALADINPVQEMIIPRPRARQRPKNNVGL